jgi:hypothetical protein
VLYSATPASGAMILACRVNAFTTATRRGHFGPSQAQALNVFFMRVSPSLFPLIGL